MKPDEEIRCIGLVMLYAIVIFFISALSAVQIFIVAVWTAFQKRDKQCQKL